MCRKKSSKIPKG